MAFWGSGKIFAVSKAMKIWLELNTSIQYYSCSLECIYTHIHIYIEGSGTPLQYSCLENPMGGGAWWATVHGVAKSWTRLSDFTLTFHFHALEKEMATHSSTLAWEIPWTEEPRRLQSMGLLRVGHDWATSLSLFTFIHWRRKWQPTPVFLPGESQGQRSLVVGSHRIGHDWCDLAAAAAAYTHTHTHTYIYTPIYI